MFNLLTSFYPIFFPHRLSGAAISFAMNSLKEVMFDGKCLAFDARFCLKVIDYLPSSASKVVHQVALSVMLGENILKRI